MLTVITVILLSVILCQVQTNDGKTSFLCVLAVKNLALLVQSQLISISLKSNIVPKVTEKNTTSNNAGKLQMWINLNVETKDEYWAMFSAVDIEDNFRTMVQQVTSYYSDAFAVKKKKNKKRFIQSKGN